MQMQLQGSVTSHTLWQSSVGYS